ncbi:hypothetical protein IWQ62_000812 [Dispira parvispora]|uniref:Uncharacterized protein n=1 Tax=Dispira parvispora TaxID=1520584 RepID=A0A9W8AXK3_9FUNG|nr:hypothetical protein IWQ62_000812 [Dispira parvispora]
MAVVANADSNLPASSEIEGWESSNGNIDLSFSSTPQNLSVDTPEQNPNSSTQEPRSDTLTAKHRKCPAKYQSTAPAGNSGDSMCGTLPYSPTTHFCENGQVCHIGDAVCGTTCISSEYKCVDPSTNKYVLRETGM